MSEYRINPDLPTPVYPSTDFLDAVTSAADMSPAAQDLVGAIYLTHYFGQGHPELTEDLAQDVAPLEVFCWQDERGDYRKIRQEVSSFFMADGGKRIATAALDHHEIADRDGIGDDKAQVIRTTYNTFWHALPAYDVLSALPTMLERVRFIHDKEQTLVSLDPFSGMRNEFNELAEGLRNDIPIHALGSLFLQIDAGVMRAGRQAGSYEGTDAHASFTREAILRRPDQVTSSAAFNIVFAGFQRNLLKGFHKREMKDLKKAWNEHHTERFVPAVFDDQRSLGCEVEGFLDRAVLFWLSRRSS